MGSYCPSMTLDQYVLRFQQSTAFTLVISMSVLSGAIVATAIHEISPTHTPVGIGAGFIWAVIVGSAMVSLSAVRVTRGLRARLTGAAGALALALCAIGTAQAATLVAFSDTAAASVVAGRSHSVPVGDSDAPFSTDEAEMRRSTLEDRVASAINQVRDLEQRADCHAGQPVLASDQCPESATRETDITDSTPPQLTGGLNAAKAHLKAVQTQYDRYLVDALLEVPDSLTACGYHLFDSVTRYESDLCRAKQGPLTGGAEYAAVTVGDVVGTVAAVTLPPGGGDASHAPGLPASEMTLFNAFLAAAFTVLYLLSTLAVSSVSSLRHANHDGACDAVGREK